MLLLWQQAERPLTELEVELLLDMVLRLGMHQLVNQREHRMHTVPAEHQIHTEVLAVAEHQTHMLLVGAHRIPTHTPALLQETVALVQLDGVHRVFRHHHLDFPTHLLSLRRLEELE